MHLKYPEFEKLASLAEEVFQVWDDQIKDFTNIARDITRKRSEKFIPIKITAAHSKIQERVSFIWNFRKQHEQLRDTILRVVVKPMKQMENDQGHSNEHINVSDVNAVDEVDAAYECVRTIDVLDVSTEGTQIWTAAESAYNERVARVENQIIAKLRDRLGTAKNAHEMFRVFSKFNALFVRPKVSSRFSLTCCTVICSGMVPDPRCDPRISNSAH
jgi:dynein heavy chain 1